MKRPRLTQQMAELRYELEKRRQVYPRQVAKGAMRQSEADHHMAALEAALDTLVWLARNERTIKQRLGDGI